jgi:alpha-ketoglutarate-dependent taurine dioxygenase
LKNPAASVDDLADEAAYQQWRQARLDAYPSNVDEIKVDIANPVSLSPAEIRKIKQACRRCNMAIYRCSTTGMDRQKLKQMAKQLGLTRLDYHLCADPDGVSSLAVADSGRKTTYVPYSNRSLSWHTDGYYNRKADQINAVVLHCVQAAESGGENQLLDPELVYILMRDKDPRFIKAFEHPDCMTIPENRMQDDGVRAAVSGPVFSYDVGGRIHMRFSARQKNIQWRRDATTHDALQYLTELLATDDWPVIRYRLKAGEGLISNNVLHNRTAFTDGSHSKRLLYRARYFDRIDT